MARHRAMEETFLSMLRPIGFFLLILSLQRLLVIDFNSIYGTIIGLTSTCIISVCANVAFAQMEIQYQCRNIIRRHYDTHPSPILLDQVFSYKIVWDAVKQYFNLQPHFIFMVCFPQTPYLRKMEMMDGCNPILFGNVPIKRQKWQVS